MRILSIETSCDDTGIAVLEVKNGSFNVLSNVIASQVEMGKKYGGVYPMMAKREHQKNLPIVLKKALKNIKNIDLIAVTSGPGLEPCLWTGINFAKELSLKSNVPIVPVNHIEAHILVNFLENPAAAGSRPGGIKFPAIALVVSGGHTQLILVKKIGSYKILGETRDDAAGECFDKCAKLLGLGYPGGPVISKLAKGITPKNIFPRPMINTKDYDFSFSGLKTAVLYYLQKNPKANKKQMAAEIQQAVIDVLIKKTIKAIKDYGAKTLILGGGVSANAELRKQFKEKIGDINFIVPKPDLSTDNGLMVAIAGYFNRTKKIGLEKIQANGNLRIGQ